MFSVSYCPDRVHAPGPLAKSFDYCLITSTVVGTRYALSQAAAVDLRHIQTTGSGSAPVRITRAAAVSIQHLVEPLALCMPMRKGHRLNKIEGFPGTLVIVLGRRRFGAAWSPRCFQLPG